MTINAKHLENMFILQESFNSKVNPDWRNANLPFVDGIWTEASEAFQYTNWEWWKKQNKEIDVSQIKMEIVDVWHFTLSELMLYKVGDGLSHLELIEAMAYTLDSTDFNKIPKNILLVQKCLKMIINSSTEVDSPERIVRILTGFISTIYALEMTWTELYKLYIGKNTLNTFRQNNGYKTDTAEYKSRWAMEKGWEDNQYLTEILANIKVGNSVVDLQLDILSSLTKAFHESTY